MSSNIHNLVLTQGLDATARSLIQRVSACHDGKLGFGSMSLSVYDTAWVSLVTKFAGEKKIWLFPESFDYILKTQKDTGGWDDHITAVDGILSTAASLLSIARHAKEPLQHTTDPEVLQTRITRADASLRSQLAAWDVSLSNHAGFEMIVPVLLELLQEEGFKFDFRDRDKLLQINAQKLSKFRPEFLYSTRKATAIYSLEAFGGKLDFDRISHHKVQGAMMASPASTAAYLINISGWDDEAEEYLRHVLKTKETGGVPAAYPSTYYEHTWIITSLLRAGFKDTQLYCPELRDMVEGLVKAFKEEEGVIGFAPFVLCDVDDTAKGLTTLNLLAPKTTDETSADRMVEMFETATHFQTYPSEKDPSFSANCNVLSALLHQSNIARYGSQILKTVRFLCDLWWNSDNGIDDKWNLSTHYSSMLLVQTFMDLLSALESGSLSDLFAQDLKVKVLITLYQACWRVTLTQSPNGSWSGSLEQTSYAVLVLAEARRLYLFEDVQEELGAAIESGISFLGSPSGRQAPPDLIWIAKVGNTATFLTDTYVLAALKASTAPSVTLASVGRGLGLDAPVVQARKHFRLLRSLSLFSSLSHWELRGAVVEAMLFTPILKARRLDVFPRQEEKLEKDHYFDIIPLIWVACNNRDRTFAPASFLYDMMVLSFLSYQADEFIEAVASPYFGQNLDGLYGVVDRLFVDKASLKETGSYSEVEGPLSRFVSHVLENTGIATASSQDREDLRRELRKFLQGQVSQTVTQTQLGGRAGAHEYFDWVRGYAADHTGCPYIFAFMQCQLSARLCKGGSCFPSLEQHYLASAASRHIGTIGRMDNDLGSVVRDADEGNLNSVDFAEFGAMATVEARKQQLVRLAAYERSMRDDVLDRLEALAAATAQRVEGRKMALWRMFCDTTELYGQIQAARDISSRIKLNGGSTNGNGPVPVPVPVLVGHS